MKEIIKRALAGMPIGAFINYAIALLISILSGSDTFIPCPPALLEGFDRQIDAVLVQLILSVLMGAAIGAGSAVWLTEWSIVLQSAVYFSILSAAMLPIAYLCHWMPHTPMGILTYLGIYVLIFLICWIVMYIIYKLKLRRINSKI